MICGRVAVGGGQNSGNYLLRGAATVCSWRGCRGAEIVIKRSNFTMKDVARLAGVSVSTVSAVVNNKPVVRAELRTKVLQAIAAVGFQPHKGARNLRMSRTHLIGMVIMDAMNPYFVEVMRGVEDEVIKNSYELMVCNSNFQIEAEKRHLDALYSHRVEGVLIAPCNSFAAREILVGNNVPLVFIDTVPVGAKVSSVVTNNLDATYETIRFLIGLGHQKIAVVAGRIVHSTTLDRLEGYRRAMQESNLPIREGYLEQGDSGIESGYQCGMKLLRSLDPPTAVLALNNRMALGVLRVLRELGLACPGSVSVVGYDDTDWAAVFNPSFTTIAQPTYEIGQKAAELLLQSIRTDEEGAVVEPRQIVLKSSLQIRQSTGPPPNS
jgi:LacI family transcriptional regulator